MNFPSSSEAVSAERSLNLQVLETWFDPRVPWRSGFLSLLRAIAARSPEAARPGTAHLPHKEPFRIGQQPTMAFAPREVASLNMRNGRLDVRLFSLGVWGPQGPLPLHMTELAYGRAESYQDHTLVRLLDVFHHRALSQFYRAWASAQVTTSLDRPDDEVFSFYVATLCGIDPAEAQRSCLPTHARYGATSHLIREARNPDGIASTLSHYFAIPIVVEEFVLHWIRLPDSERTRIGFSAGGSTMGQDAQLGEAVPDRQHRFRLVLGPLELDQYVRFLPDGKDLIVLVEWCRAFIGYEYAWEIKLLLKPHAAPPGCTGTSHKLGYSTWLGESMDDAPVVGMVFEPELYCDD